MSVSGSFPRLDFHTLSLIKWLLVTRVQGLAGADGKTANEVALTQSHLMLSPLSGGALVPSPSR